MIDLLVLNRTIRTVVRETLSMAADSVRPANQKSPVPKEGVLFATVEVASVSPTGQDTRHEVNIDNPAKEVRESMIGQRMVMASVNFYRKGANSFAHSLVARMALSSVQASLQSKELGFVRASAVRDLTAIVDANYEERSQVDLFFHVIQKESNDLATYGTFPISTDIEIISTQSEVLEP